MASRRFNDRKAMHLQLWQMHDLGGHVPSDDNSLKTEKKNSGMRRSRKGLPPPAASPPVRVNDELIFIRLRSGTLWQVPGGGNLAQPLQRGGASRTS